MSTWSPDLYLAAWNFAADAHGEQMVPGSQRPYLTHIGAVAMEVVAALAARSDVDDPDLCVQCAILHDVVEDTEASVDDIATTFGARAHQSPTSRSVDGEARGPHYKSTTAAETLGAPEDWALS